MLAFRKVKKDQRLVIFHTSKKLDKSTQDRWIIQKKIVVKIIFKINNQNHECNIHLCHRNQNLSFNVWATIPLLWSESANKANNGTAKKIKGLYIPVVRNKVDATVYQVVICVL